MANLRLGRCGRATRLPRQRRVPMFLSGAVLAVSAILAVSAAPASASASASASALRSASASASYENPFQDEQPYVGRTDMGVDLCMSPGDRIRALGDGVVIGIERGWAGNQPYVWYQLTTGRYAGRYVYVAEQIRKIAPPGTKLHAGDVIARYARKGTCIETGWATADGETLASATTGYTEGQVTKAGVAFARVLISVGVVGEFELKPTPPPKPGTNAKRRHHRRGRARR